MKGYFMTPEDELKETVLEVKARLNAKSVTKFLVKNAIGISTNAIIIAICKEHYTPVKRFDNLKFKIGSNALGAMVSDHVEDWADVKFEDYWKAFAVIVNGKDETSEDKPKEPIIVDAEVVPSQ